MQGNQHWIAVPTPESMEKADSKEAPVVLLKHATGLCLELGHDGNARKLKVVNYCDTGNTDMHWKFGHFDLSKLEDVNH